MALYYELQSRRLNPPDASMKSADHLLLAQAEHQDAATQRETVDLGAAALVALWSWRRGISLSLRNGTLAAGLLAGTLFALEFAAMFVGLQYTLAISPRTSRQVPVIPARRR